MKLQTSSEKIDLFKNTFRASMPLTDDYVFHAVFGRDTEESRAALIEILNIILERKQDPIRAIVIKNPIEIPEREADKESVMDIRAETESGELLDIEMQAGDLQFYQNRALFYGSRLVNSALQVGEKYDKMKKSIVISITSGRLFPSLAGCHNIFEMRDRECGLLLCDRLELHFLELSKIDGRKPVSALTEIERLGAYLKFASVEDRQDYVQQILPSVDKGTHGLQRLLCFVVFAHRSTTTPRSSALHRGKYSLCKLPLEPGGLKFRRRQGRRTKSYWT